MLTSLSTAHPESLFSFLRLSNVGSSNPTMEHLILGISRHTTRGASSNVVKSMKNSIEPERREEILKQLFLVGEIIVQKVDVSRTSLLRAHSERE